MSGIRTTSRLLTAVRAGALLSLGATALGAQAASSVPTPASVIGFEPGADRKLPTWKQVTDYFTALDKASPRVTLRTLGKTTLGRPFLVAFIADPATLANLGKYQQIQRKLMDPRLRDRNERDQLIADGKLVVLITSSIHSTEVGGILTPMVLAERLARADTPEARQVLANSIIMLVPSQNPDGVDIVGDYYRSTLGTQAEGNGPPDLYHHYTGHDNNRDWYAFTQLETRYTVDSLYTPWDPQIVNDIHQQGSNAGRIFIPPYMDPVEPNIDPILTAGTNSLGSAMSWRMISGGFTGVATNASYDQWSPARQYSLNHRGVRILTETASARLASPMDIPFDRLGPGRGYDARETTWNHPVLWPGGTWGIGDIVKYQTAASWAMLVEAARDRQGWLESYADMGDRALGTLPAWGKDPWPSAFVIPKAQADTQALQRMVWTLQHGQVEIRESSAAVTANGKSYPAGSYVVLVRQPFGTYAKALLERQKYPDLREYPGGPPKRPYDVTAHTLPLLFGVDVAAVMGEAPATGEIVKAIPEPKFTTALSESRARRVAIFRTTSNESMDAGWTRWMFDKYRVPFTVITEKDVAAGSLNAKFDAIVIPDQAAQQLERAIGEAGASALGAFVENGGSVLAFNDASGFAIDALKLPVKNVLEGTKNTEFYAPGSIFGVDVNRSHPLAAGLTAPVPGVWFEDSPAFDITDSSAATAVLTYPASGNALLSGWLLGPGKLNGKAAMVDVKRGRGHVILYGFRPQYRGQSNATFPLIWSAIGKPAM
ncbi:MAG TPA: M14 family zinc carboxypeptidase [Gemmatimonadaceae bacterium]|nr:M14 family zinc carboxypeptidase [Gemmatimonadaceae bacterium]